MNEILWNNSMTIAICLRTELDIEEFENRALSVHKELTGDPLIAGEYMIYKSNLIHVLEVI